MIELASDTAGQVMAARISHMRNIENAPAGCYHGIGEHGKRALLSHVGHVGSTEWAGVQDIPLSFVLPDDGCGS